MLFLNRSSGVRLSADELRSLEEAARDAGLDVVELAPDLDVPQRIRDGLRAGQNLFVAAGGDGTVHHVMQALVHTEGVLAVVPTGTYNHFARDLGIPLEWRDALSVATAGQVRQIDAGRANDRFFVNNLSIGLYPELVTRREEHGRNYPRWKARLYALYTTLQKYPHVTLTLESAHHQEVIRTHVFMVSNNSYDLEQMGVEASRAMMTEGRLSVYWLPHTPRLKLMKYAARYLAGRVRTIPGFRSFRTQHVRVQSSRDHLKVGIDGEVFTIQLPLAITAVPQSLLVKVP